MPIFALSEEVIFPPVELSEDDGLLAVGGDLSPQRLLLAYRMGIFPWYNRKPILWWSPDPRFVLYPEELKVSRSMRQVLTRNIFEITVNQNFKSVILNCKQAPREGQSGTWITREVMNAYLKLHQLGHAHSVEAWQNGELVGGLYGVRVGNVFCGESMFAKVSNASKAAFITYIKQLQSEGVQLIDCQMETEHLASFGGRFITRDEFVRALRA
ncbi:MAG: leucyl/phenylalanyl-tRNA--protein transferase [Bacteroidia bacterium]